MKYYHMIVGNKCKEEKGDYSTRTEYISRRQGAAPAGYICVAVVGYHEKREPERVCEGCKYFHACGDRSRTEYCDGREEA